ncbi:uncharacterized protein LOC62_02G002977 [Vanrija pseudolonga]|uniref:Uncharacterized protein n=1 Tax=Vanrija pseudolonga TaxID=143232 RepID=A0AAF1BJ39_9TREE|nr:hypothetical protein LOC62_02G002977 [Vanrija pseudolonga]
MRALIRLSSTPAPPILSLPGFDPSRPPPERDTFLPESPVASPEAATSPGRAVSAAPCTAEDKVEPAQPTSPDLAPAAPVTSHYFEKPEDASTMPAVAPLPSKPLIPPFVNASSDPIAKIKATETPRRAPAPVGDEFDDIVELSESDFTPEEILRSESKRKRKGLSVPRRSHTPAPAPSSAPTVDSIDLSVDSSPPVLRKSPRIARSNASSTSTPSRQAINALKDHIASPSKSAAASSSRKAATPSRSTRRRVQVSSDSEGDYAPPAAVVESSDDEVLRRPKRSRTKSPAKEASSSSSKSPSPKKSQSPAAAKSSASSSPARSSNTAKLSPPADTPSPSKSIDKGKERAEPSPKRSPSPKRPPPAALADLFADDDDDDEADEFDYLDDDLDYNAIPFPDDGIAIPDFSQYPPVRGPTPSPPVYGVPDDDDEDDDFLPLMVNQARSTRAAKAASPSKSASPIKFKDLKFITDLDDRRLQSFYRNHWRHKGAEEEDEQEEEDDEHFSGVAAPVTELKKRGPPFKRGGKGGRGGKFRPWGKRGGRR